MPVRTLPPPTLALLLLAAACGGPAHPRPAHPRAARPAPAAQNSTAQNSAAGDSAAGESAAGESAAGASAPLARTGASTGVDDAALQQLLEAHWAWVRRENPRFSTMLGDHRYDDRLRDNAEPAVLRRRAERDAFLARARAIGPAGLSGRDRTTLSLFTQSLSQEAATDVCEHRLWSLSAMRNLLLEVNRLPDDHRVESVADGRNLVARVRQIPRLFDHHIAQLRRGADLGMVTNRISLRRVLAQLDAELAKPLESWALWKPSRAPHPSWPAEAQAAFAADLEAAVRDGVAEAVRRFRAAVAELIPQGRSGSRVGLVGLPRGAACYQAELKRYTGLPRTAEALHQLGMQEIDRINDEMRVLGHRLFDTDDLADITARLRTDRSLYFDSAEAVLSAAREALARSQAAMPQWFARMPRAACVVAAIPDYEAPYSPLAYYRRPHADGSKPGEFFINTHQPEVRPRFGMQALVYHESIPGHHLQIAIAQEQDALPAFRRYGGNTAFVEGWALYTERLAEEMGLYSGDLDRMGMLGYEAWRAARLVLDTGIHAKGWTRAQAERFMLERTALSEDNIRNEVDRYITLPGQAVAYKVGQLEILRLRRQARAQLGARFDIKAFHDVVLRRGAVTLPVLAEHIAAWVNHFAE